MNVWDFYAPWEKTVTSYREASELIHDVFDKWTDEGHFFAWRGQVDADWALHSSLYRRLAWTGGAPPWPMENDLLAKEQEILERFQRWGLHSGDTGRLAALSQLAVMQHYGAPTRLIDVTFNPLIGLWFAVEEKYDNGEIIKEDKPGRLFAVDVSNRLINEIPELQSWEDEATVPWPTPANGQQVPEWSGRTWAWRPARLDHRITAQNGGFLLGGVPNSSVAGRPLQWPKEPRNDSDKWGIEDVRACTSVALRLHKLDARGGAAPMNPAYTIRIEATAKAEIRKRLQELFGYRSATLYPDYSGFAQYASPTLKTRP